MHTRRQVCCDCTHVKNHYHILGVKDRQWVLFHRGNYAGDTTLGLGYLSDVEGCILIGDGVETIKVGKLQLPQRYVTNSASTFTDFIALLGALT